MFDLKRFRKDKKLSQHDAAMLLGITQGFISRMETGKDLVPDEYKDILRNKYGDEVDRYITVVPHHSKGNQQTISGKNKINTIAGGDIKNLNEPNANYQSRIQLLEAKIEMKDKRIKDLEAMVETFMGIIEYMKK